MQGKTYWIDKGHLELSRPAHPGDSVFHRGGLVRMVTGGMGTEIKWSVFSPCFASLFLASECLLEMTAPFMLRYYLAGWFEEMCETAPDARRRIEEIVARSDIHLLRRVFVREFDPRGRTLPPLLQDAWLDGAAGIDHSVDCVYEEDSRRFRVDRIGAKSTIARLWGSAPVSYPCVSGGTYDRIVSAAYGDVLKQGRPRYDHVYAAMRTPAGKVMWIPYQRVIRPKPMAGGRLAVAIVTEIAKVEIHIV